MWTDTVDREFKKTRWIALSMLVWAPIVYLIVAYLMDAIPKAGGEQDLMFYILLIVAIVEPAFGFVIERFQLAMYRRSTGTKMSPGQLLSSTSIVKCALVDAVFIFGLAVLFVGGPIERMLAFYPIGIIWAFIHWPRRGRWETQIQKLEMP